MGTPFMAEIRIMSFNFAPAGWAQCNGQFMPINQNQALFSLLGTSYGGNGQTTFALPDMRGRVGVHAGSQLPFVGQSGGEEFHTVNMNEMPTHNHFVSASTQNANSQFISVTVPAPSQNILAVAPGGIYGPASNLTTLDPATISNVGGSQPHENRQPFTVLNLCIALQGVFPSRN
jgi:microcystin-dependent protein